MPHRSLVVAVLLAALVLAQACGATRPARGKGGEEALLQRAEILRAEDRRDPGAARAALDHSSHDVRSAAALALGRIRDRADRSSLERALDDRAATVRAAAAIGLGLLGDRAASGPLAAHASDPVSAVRAAVADGLGRLADPGTEGIVARLLADDDPAVLVAASFAVLGFERPAFAVDPLIALAEHGQRDALLAAVETLARLSARPRWLELEALRRVRERMIDLTRSPHPELRRLGALGLTVPGSDPEAAAVGRLVEDAEPDVRIAAIGALSFPGAPLAPFLVKVLGDREERVQFALVEGLGRMRGDEILEALSAIVVSAKPLWLREAAVRAAARVSQSSARIANGLSRATEPELRRAAAALLIGRIDAETQPAADRLYADPDPLVRAAIVPAYAEVAGDLAEILAAAIASGDPRVRAAVAEAAGRRLAGEGSIGPRAEDDAVGVLSTLWKAGSAEPAVAFAVVNAAGRSGPQDRLRTLLDEASRAANRRVREAASGTLSRVYGDPRPRTDPPGPDRPVDEYLEILRWAERPRAAIVTVTRPHVGDRARFVVRLRAREKPLHAWQFAQLATSGFYDGLPFFRVVPNVLAQTGDPERDGTGGPVYEVRDELGGDRFGPGTLATVPAGRDYGSNQWLITLGAQPQLAPTHTAFADVVQNFAGVAARILPGDLVVRIEMVEGDGTAALPAIASTR